MENRQRIEILKQYIEEDPLDAFSYYALALEYVKIGENDQAKKLMEHVHTHHPSYLPNYYHFGKLLERTGDISIAQKIYEAGMVIAKEQSDLHARNELQGALDSMDE